MLALLPGDDSRTHGERLPAEIAAALDRAGVARDELDLLAVAAGPGGFTGLRIGLAAVQGLAMTLNKPVAGVSALDALAEQIGSTQATIIVPWMDAQRGDVFATVIDARSKATLEEAVAEGPAAVLDRWRSRLAGQHVVFIGDAVTRDQAFLENAGNPQWHIRSRSTCAANRGAGATAGRAGQSRTAARADPDLRSASRCRDRARDAKSRRGTTRG